MAISPGLKSSYEAVLKDLEGDRATVYEELVGLQRKLRELDQNIASLSRRMGGPIALMRNPSVAPQRVLPEQKYAFISVHWAILHLLSEAVGPMTSFEIAEALKNAGVKTRAANFTNNVSAVLSTNMRPKGDEEVEMIDGKWKLTEKGRNKITHIVGTPKFRKSCPWLEDSDQATQFG